MATRRKPKRLTHLQSAVARAIAKGERSRYQISLACGWKPSRIYQALAFPVNGDAIEHLLAACGAVVEIGGERLRLSLDRSGRVLATTERPGESKGAGRANY